MTKWYPKQYADGGGINKNSGAASTVLLKFGVPEGISDLTEFGIYFTPIGGVLAGADALKSFSQGDWQSGLLNLAFAVPGVGLIARGVSKGTKILNTIQKVSKTAFNVKSKADKVSKTMVPIERIASPIANGEATIFTIQQIPDAIDGFKRGYYGEDYK